MTAGTLQRRHDRGMPIVHPESREQTLAARITQGPVLKTGAGVGRWSQRGFSLAIPAIAQS
jgi:hypothetical protein